MLVRPLRGAAAVVLRAYTIQKSIARTRHAGQRCLLPVTCKHVAYMHVELVKTNR